ncbi:MAG TPA: ABC-2 family transporter protein [Candidatus Eremiobacteraceae bacterium]|nr:ABC-2 family transporter protein [Candidatus Eremiobacteraceae bacterium]
MSAQAYVEFAKRAFEREGTYRFQVFTKIGAVALRVFLLSTLWTNLYRANGAQAGISLNQMVTYVVIALLLDIVYGVNGAYVVREKIREGSIAIDFMRPISVPLYVFGDTVGQTGFALLECIPALLLASLIVHVGGPPSPLALLGFIAAVGIGFVVNYFIDLIMATLTFWTMEIFGLQLMMQFISSLLSGSLVPLYFFPQGWFQNVLLASPFAALYNAPLSIWIGKYQGVQIVQSLALQAMWAVVFGLFAMWLWRVGERKVVVQGG